MHTWQLLLVVETLMTDHADAIHVPTYLYCTVIMEGTTEYVPRARYLQVLAEPNAVERTGAPPASGSWDFWGSNNSPGLRCHVLCTQREQYRIAVKSYGGI